MNAFRKLHNIFNFISKKTPDKNKTAAIPNSFSPQSIYQSYDFDTGELRELIMDFLKPAKSLVEDISINFSDEQLFYSEVNLKSFLKPFSFRAKVKLVDLWQDQLTSTGIFELIQTDIHLISLLPRFIQNWCGKKLISLISFWGTFVQEDSKCQRAHFYLQEQFLYIDFQPWLNAYYQSSDEDAGNHWITKFFNKHARSKGKRYLQNHIIFGAEILGEPATLRIYLYRMPASFYKIAEIEKEGASYKSSFAGNWLEWLFAISTSFLLVSFLVPFGMAYMKLAPVEFDNLLSLPFIFLYNTFIVLIPLFIFRIVLIPMRRVWETRHGRIEILQAEVSRDQVFMPLLREWIIVLQKTDKLQIPYDMLQKIREFLLKIGTQKYWLVNKISLIEKRRRMYVNIIIFSYLGVCLIELLFLTGILPTPQFIANNINHLLEIILLK